MARANPDRCTPAEGHCLLCVPVTPLLLTVSPPGETFSYPADAVVFAVGITGMQKLVTATPALAQQVGTFALSPPHFALSNEEEDCGG